MPLNSAGQEIADQGTAASTGPGCRASGDKGLRERSAQWGRRIKPEKQREGGRREHGELDQTGL